MAAMELIQEALKKGQKNLSEYDSKRLLAGYDIPVTREKLATSADEAVKFAGELGYPVVLKGCGPMLTHKTEKSVIRVGLDNDEEVREAFESIYAVEPMDGVIVQEMVKGDRELVIGLIRDPQFGPCVMFGLGGIYTEVLKDVAFRVAPLEERDARDMMEEIKSAKILGEFRGMAAADREVLTKALIGMGRLGLENDSVAEVDVNPLIVARDGKPAAVDALVVLAS